MTKSTNITCAAYSALFAAAVLAVLCLKGTWSGFSPALDALAVLAVHVLGYALTRHKSLLSFAISFLPALFMVPFFLTGGAVWLWLSAALLVALALTYNLRHDALPKPRFTTQKWLAALILAEVMLAVIMLLICF